MKYHHLVLLCCAFISIFSIRGVYSDSKVHVYTDLDDDPIVVPYTPKKTVTLRCNTSESGVMTWLKGGKPVTTSSRIFIEDQNSTLRLKELTGDDAGNYTCVVSVGTTKINDSVALESDSKYGIRLPKNNNVVEGEKLLLKCEVRGPFTLEWWYKNTTSGENFTRITGQDRIKLSNYTNEQGKLIVNGELLIDAVDMGDRGEYTCQGITPDGRIFNMTSTVRIKDQYAALWPFIGICAEVFVLCAIIFIYEKKRNKTELDESDTDQSPDQKNTPDHGKESNLRHRQ